MRIDTTAIDGVLLIEPTRHGDARGWFMETYRQDLLADAGFAGTFVQDNHAYSTQRGTLRGLHFQRPPYGQDKLVRCSRGHVFDVAVDLRPDSATFGRHVAVELSAENGRALLVPAGFAHGYCALAPDTEVQYKVSALRAAEHESGLMWNDPALAIDWPVRPDEIILSERDKTWPVLAELVKDGAAR